MNREIRAASKLPRGLYDGLVTEALAELLDSLGGVSEPEFMDLRNADAADRMAFHVAKVIENALDRRRMKAGPPQAQARPISH